VAPDAQSIGDPGMSSAGLVMPTRILLIGAGGREHALAWKLAGEPGVNEVIVAPGSYGIAAEPRVRRLPAVDPLDPSEVVAVARHEAVELVVVGPEAPLAAGVADALIDAGVAVFGPTADAARIESSKAFCHEIAAAAGVPMARSAVVEQGDPLTARAFARAMLAEGGGVVVKVDGLAAGKGVTVAGTVEEADAAIQTALELGPVVIEELLVGREASLIAISDGRQVLALPLARDHKRLADGERGPNTGGMGAYSPLPDVADEGVDALLERFHRPILAELRRRGTTFRGALYAGLMLTADGPVLLECNARFGDPEAQVILPRLGAPLGPVLLAAAKGRLREATRPLRITDARLPTLPIATVGVVLAAAGYPEEPRRGDAIEGLYAARASGSLVFHAGTSRDEDGGFRTAGGRVLTIVGRGPDLAAARQQAENAAAFVSFDGLQRRHDIGLDVPAGVEAGA
jgi:phosphoribosylamine---glycine ligase